MHEHENFKSVKEVLHNKLKKSKSLESIPESELLLQMAYQPLKAMVLDNDMLSGLFVELKDNAEANVEVVLQLGVC
jgi:hypothetical protein